MKQLQVFVKNMKVAQNKQKGFSLIELLVVMFIIGLLTTVLLPNLMGARQKAKDTQRINDMNSIKGALRLYYNDNQIYPTPASSNKIGIGISNYLPGVDQIGVGYTYVYSVSTDGDGFVLKLKLESPAGEEDMGSQERCGVGATDGWYAVCGN